MSLLVSSEHHPEDSRSESSSGTSFGTSFAPTPTIYRMRCPKCQKLFSAQGETLQAALNPLRFNCGAESGGCGTRFAASVGWGFTLGDLVITREIFDDRPVSPVRPRTTLVKTPMAVAEHRCPKCGSRNLLAALECRFCGVVFAKAKVKVDDRPELEVPAELAHSWARVMTDYENRSSHETFISSCQKADRLAFAGQKYARILSAAPQEEIARAMRDRIVGLATYRTELRGSKPAWEFRVPGFNNLILAFGGALTVMGLMLPRVSHLAGLGVASIALGLGVRLLLKPLP